MRHNGNALENMPWKAGDLWVSMREYKRRRSSPDCCTTLKIQSHNMIGSFNNFHICINRLQVWTYVQRARSNAWTIPGSIVLRADFMVYI